MAFVDNTFGLALAAGNGLRLDQTHRYADGQHRFDFFLDLLFQRVHPLDLIGKDAFIDLDHNFDAVELVRLTVNYELIMRMRAFNTKKHMFDLRREDIDAAHNDHIVRAAFDFAGAGAGATASAWNIGHADNIPCAIADQRNALFG